MIMNSFAASLPDAPPHGPSHTAGRAGAVNRRIGVRIGREPVSQSCRQQMASGQAVTFDRRLLSSGGGDADTGREGTV